MLSWHVLVEGVTRTDLLVNGFSGFLNTEDVGNWCQTHISEACSASFPSSQSARIQISALNAFQRVLKVSDCSR